MCPNKLDGLISMKVVKVLLKVEFVKLNFKNSQILHFEIPEICVELLFLIKTIAVIDGT